MTLPTICWTHAKTYADAVHEYVVKGRVPMAFFDFYKDKLKTEGVSEQFTLRGKTTAYRYYYGGYKYWIIGPILNRCKAGGPRSA